MAHAMAYGDQVLAAATAGQASLLWGAAGQGLFLRSLWRASLRQEYLDGAVRLAEAILQGMLPAMFGGAWPPNVNTPLPAVPVGLAAGLAGIGALFPPLYRATRDERWVDTLRTMAELLRRTAVPEHGGVSWPPRLDGGGKLRALQPDVVRCQWCLGAPGIGLFLARAGEALRDSAMTALAIAAAETTYAYGDVRANPSQCHGLAGNAELLLELWRITREPVWLDRAHDFARQILAYRIDGPPTDSWPADEPGYVAPNFSTGAAGVGHFFLRLLDPDRVPVAIG